MRVTVDTNVLVRVIVQDDPAQARAAEKLLLSAEVIAVPLLCLCELAWLLRTRYGLATSQISQAVRAVLDIENVVVDRVAVQAGLAMLDGGGDFADAIVAYEGRLLGGQIFASFDRKAVTLMQAAGYETRLLK